MVRPSALAVLRLMTSSNFVGCSTGRSPGLAPPEDLVQVGRGAPIQVENARSIPHEAAEFHEFSRVEHRRQPVFRGEHDDASPFIE